MTLMSITATNYNPGNALELNQYQVFDVALTQNEQSPHDPSVNCEEYNSSQGFHNCVTKTAEDKFLSIIGCVPPLFSNNEDLVCQNKYIKSVNQRIKYSRTLYDQLIVGKSSNDCLLHIADKQTFVVQTVKIKKMKAPFPFPRYFSQQFLLNLPKETLQDDQDIRQPSGLI